MEPKYEIRDFDDVEDEETSVKIKENELRLDPIFQNLPNNESILYYVYEVLAKKVYFLPQKFKNFLLQFICLFLF